MTDKATIRIVVIALAIGALGGMAAVSLLVWSKVPASELAVVAGLAGQSLGALTGLLISTRSQEQPQEVTVMNQGPAEAVPVAEAGHSDLTTVLIAALVSFAVVVFTNLWVFDLDL